MTGLTIISSLADQCLVNDYAADLQVGVRHLELESLTAINRSASNFYLQLFNLPFTADARAISASVAATGALTLANHRFQDGDAVITVGIPGVTDGTYYVRIAPTGTRPDLGADPNTFYLYDTAAHAVDRTSLTGQVAVSNGAAGTVQITGVVPEELPLMGTGSAPSNIVSYLNARFPRGLYVRAVTAINGSTKATADVKFTARWRYSHGAL